MNKLICALLFIIFLIIVYELVIKKNKNSFAATNTISDFVNNLINPSSSSISPSQLWLSTFDGVGYFKSNSIPTNGAFKSSVSLPNGPFLFPDPGWYQPTVPSDGYVGTYTGNTVSKAASLVVNNANVNTDFPYIGNDNNYAATNDGTYYSTSINFIPNPFFNSSNTLTLADPLQVVSNQYTFYTSGPAGTQGEYGAFNAYFQYDKYASLFMNNDAQIVPFTINSGGAISMNLLSGMYTYYNFTNIPFVFTGTMYSLTNKTPSGPKTISYNQAVGIPADFAIPGYDLVNSVGVGNALNYGTPKRTSAYIQTSSGAFTNSQLLRTYIITGTLASLHYLFNASTSLNAPNGMYGSWTNGIINDLELYYQPNTICLATNLVGTLTPFYVSYNTLHAIYLTLMARDAWIQNQITNVNLL